MGYFYELWTNVYFFGEVWWSFLSEHVEKKENWATIFRRFHTMPWPPNGSLNKCLDSRLVYIISRYYFLHLHIYKLQYILVCTLHGYLNLTAVIHVPVTWILKDSYRLKCTYIYDITREWNAVRNLRRIKKHQYIFFSILAAKFRCFFLNLVTASL